MSVSTRQATAKAKMDALDHVLVNVLGFEEDSPTVLALQEEQVASIVDLCCLSPEDIDSIQLHSAETGTVSKSLPVAHRSKLKGLKSFALTLSDGQFPADDLWLPVSAEDYNTYRTTPVLNKPESSATKADTSSESPSPVSETPSSSSSSSTATHKKTPTELFLASVKRDIKDYVSLKEDKQWLHFRNNAISTGTLHGVSNVFDPEYSPSSDSDKDLFDTHQIFVYTVLLKHVQTPVGKTLVLECPGDGQLAWSKLVDYYTNSPAAKIESQNLQKKSMRWISKLGKVLNTSLLLFTSPGFRSLKPWHLPTCMIQTIRRDPH